MLTLDSSSSSCNVIPLTKYPETPFRMSKEDYDKYALGDWHLQCGTALSDAHIAYKTIGDPKAPAIVCTLYFPRQFFSFMLSYGSANVSQDFSAPKTCLATQYSSRKSDADTEIIKILLGILDVRMHRSVLNGCP